MGRGLGGVADSISMRKEPGRGRAGVGGAKVECIVGCTLYNTQAAQWLHTKYRPTPNPRAGVRYKRIVELNTDHTLRIAYRWWMPFFPVVNRFPHVSASPLHPPASLSPWYLNVYVGSAAADPRKAAAVAVAIKSTCAVQRAVLVALNIIGFGLWGGGGGRVLTASVLCCSG